jgi:peptidoglycan/LPS O-acetylase OafA/YrhL
MTTNILHHFFFSGVCAPEDCGINDLRLL